MNICVIGGGNIGTTLAADLASMHPEYSLRLLTSKPELFRNPIQINDIEGNTTLFGKLDVISSDPQDTVKDSDIIFITHQSFLIEQTLSQIKQWIKKGAFVGIIPGFGGCEFFWKDHFDETITLFGYQRVPYIARMKEYGRIANLTSRKSELIIGSIPAERCLTICKLLQEFSGVICIPIPNYLAVTLTPSNPLLHTARIYDLFCNAEPDSLFSRNPKFYAEWTKHASKVLLTMDDELQMLYKRIEGLDLTSVISLRTYYESNDADELTRKMRSIVSLKDIDSPMRSINDGFVPDIRSRYFIEDFPYGLCIIKGFCEIYGVITTMIDQVLHWYERFAGVEYYQDEMFIGKDLKHTATPQNFGLLHPADVTKYYSEEGIVPTHQY